VAGVRLGAWSAFCSCSHTPQMQVSSPERATTRELANSRPGPACAACGAPAALPTRAAQPLPLSQWCQEPPLHILSHHGCVQRAWSGGSGVACCGLAAAGLASRAARAPLPWRPAAAARDWHSGRRHGQALSAASSLYSRRWQLRRGTRPTKHLRQPGGLPLGEAAPGGNGLPPPCRLSVRRCLTVCWLCCCCLIDAFLQVRCTAPLLVPVRCAARRPRCPSRRRKSSPRWVAGTQSRSDCWPSEMRQGLRVCSEMHRN